MKKVLDPGGPALAAESLRALAVPVPAAALLAVPAAPLAVSLTRLLEGGRAAAAQEAEL